MEKEGEINLTSAPERRSPDRLWTRDFREGSSFPARCGLPHVKADEDVGAPAWGKRPHEPGPGENSMENIRQPAFQPRHDLLKATQGDALLALLQTVQCGGGQAELLGKLGKRHVAMLFAQEHGQLFFHPRLFIRRIPGFDFSRNFGIMPAFTMFVNLQLDGAAWSAVLADLAQALLKEGPPIRLCLIGSAACLFGGMDGRTSADLDIWKPASDFDRLELQRAAEKAGLLFDPKQSLEPGRPYLQLVEPGLTQLGVFEPVFIERMGRLHLYRPPVENLIAAKLIRAEPKDLADIQFLVSRHRPDLNRVREIAAQFNDLARERATENLVYLQVLTP
jgi:hypothetical protein